MEQEVCQQCKMCIENDTINYYNFCSAECYYMYMAEYDKEKLSMSNWDWS
jgi:hypothetical protein